MTGSFLDTTIVVHISDDSAPNNLNAANYVNKNQPSKTPYYALRELLAGHVQILCETHNILLAAENPAEAMGALLRQSHRQGRKRLSRIQAWTKAYSDTFTSNPTGSRNDQKREMLQEIALRINGIWRRSHQLKNVSLVQSLGCLNDGKLSLGAGGELRGPNDSFNCIKSARCQAAAYIFDDNLNLEKMIEALHPNNLSVDLAAKNENSQRRKALKELSEKGPQQFNKQKCRALGDAYFAAMCPIGSVVATSNLSDHSFLCEALGKKAVMP